MSSPLPDRGFEEWLVEVRDDITAAIGASVDIEAGLAEAKHVAAGAEYQHHDVAGLEAKGAFAVGTPVEGAADAVRVGEGRLEAGAAAVLVRPYARTGGRTRSRVDIAMESLITTTTRGAADSQPRSRDWSRIAELCHQTQSLAEVAAHLHVPLGVARVIVGDMTEAGLLEIHEPARLDDQLGTHLLERVLHGLRRL